MNNAHPIYCDILGAFVTPPKPTHRVVVSVLHTSDGRERAGAVEREVRARNAMDALCIVLKEIDDAGNVAVSGKAELII